MIKVATRVSYGEELSELAKKDNPIINKYIIHIKFSVSISFKISSVLFILKYMLLSNLLSLEIMI